jgi:glycosyltransferase involved in cell wall biosynthesis
MNNRIALFFPSLRIAGVQRFMLTIGDGLLDSGYDVDFVLVKAQGPFLSQVPDGIRVVDLNAKGSVASVPALVRYLKTEKPDAMISAQTHVNVIAIIARRLANSKVRLVVSERSHLSSSTKLSTKRTDHIMPLLARIFYRSADAVVTVSKGCAADLSMRTGLDYNAIHVVYNPYQIERIAEKSRESVDHPWFFPGQPPVFLAVGRLEQPKDYPTLVRSFAIVRSKMNSRLVILGDGYLRSELLRLSNELGIYNDVSLPGFVDNPYAYMSKAAVYVLSSAWEGFPNVLVEALACGAQAVSTDCPSGPSEILEGGHYGQLVPVGNHQALAAAMIHTYRNPLPSDLLKSRASEYTVEKTVHGYLYAAGIE